tara:strand:- start:33812 stop:34171 length:360 start_codon:yes stop_codon:yes gene_type:complete
MDLVSNYVGKTDILDHPKYKQYGSVQIKSGDIEEMISFWSDPSNRKYINIKSKILADQYLNYGMNKTSLGYTLRNPWTGGDFIGRRKASKQSSREQSSSQIISTGVHGGTIFWRYQHNK